MVKIEDLKIGMRVKLKSIEQLKKEGCYEEENAIRDDRVNDYVTPYMIENIFNGDRIVTIDLISKKWFCVEEDQSYIKYNLYPEWIEKIIE